MRDSEDRDDREAESRAVASGMEWAMRITVVGFEMVVPGVLGVWLDEKLGTKLVFTLIGFALGLSWALWHLLKMTGKPGGPKT